MSSPAGRRRFNAKPSLSQRCLSRIGCTREFGVVGEEHWQAAAIHQNVFRIVIRARHQHKTLMQISRVPHAHVVHIGNAAMKAVGSLQFTREKLVQSMVIRVVVGGSCEEDTSRPAYAASMACAD